MSNNQPNPLYPPIEPYQTGYIEADGHKIYWELVGNPQGKPAVFLHGGPGAGCSADHRRLFNPEKYNVLLFDQRGCGRSTPFASLENNTTWDLVKDIETFRTQILKAEKILVFGGSWGSTLALAYAQTHPEHVSELVVRGIFTLRDEEIKWFYQEGASFVYPDYWEEYLSSIPAEEHDDLVSAYHKRLTGTNEEEKLRAAYTWSRWESRCINLLIDEGVVDRFSADQFCLPFASIENHYFFNKGFLTPNQLINEAYKLKDIPGVIIQGRYDMCTPMKTAWDLHKAWPSAEFIVAPIAGHSFSEPGIIQALINATDKFAD